MELSFEKTNRRFFKEFENTTAMLQITRTLLNTGCGLAGPQGPRVREYTVKLFRLRPKREDLCPVPL